jgi:hypothetical protein
MALNRFNIESFQYWTAKGDAAASTDKAREQRLPAIGRPRRRAIFRSVAIGR